MWNGWPPTTNPSVCPLDRLWWQEGRAIDSIYAMQVSSARVATLCWPAKVIGEISFVDAAPAAGYRGVPR